MRRILIPASTALALLLASPLWAGPLDEVPLNTAALGEPAPIRLLVVVQRHSESQFIHFQAGAYTPLYQDAMATRDAYGRPVLDAGSDRAEDMFAVWFAFGAVAMIGGLQEAARERAAVETVALPEHQRLDALHDAEVDHALLTGLTEQIQARTLLTISDARLERIDLQGLSDSARRKRDWEFDDWLESQDAGDRTPILTVHLRHAVHPHLAGVWGVADVRWVLPPQSLPNIKRSARVGDRILGFARSFGLVASPVPYPELHRPPAHWVAAQVAHIQAEYDPEIERTRDHGYRRALRTKRNSLLEEVRGPWQPLDQTEHMLAAWQAEPREAYPRVMTRALRDLATRIVATLCADDGGQRICRTDLSTPGAAAASGGAR